MKNGIRYCQNGYDILFSSIKMVQPLPSLYTIRQHHLRLDVDWKSIRRRLDVECKVIMPQGGGGTL